MVSLHHNSKHKIMLFITINPILLDFIQDLLIEPMDDSMPAILEPVERDYLTNSSLFYLHQPARFCLTQVKPSTKPTLRPRRRLFTLARSSNSNDDAVSH
jgi:hypothetical protein